MAEFEGSFPHKIDAKGRLSLPSGFRKGISQELKMILSPDGDSLWAFESDAYTQWVEHLFDKKGGFDPTNRQMAAQRKILNSRVTKCEIDNSGRIRLSVKQREDAQLDHDVVIVGDTDHFEIWDAERWETFCAEFDLSSLFC